MCDKNPEEIDDKRNATVIDETVVKMSCLKLEEGIDSDYEDYGEGTSSGCNKSYPKYPKNSLDRFGDDLVELILSYLPFSDKVLLESVSRQWQRTIYTKQTELHLNRSETEEYNTLNKLLKDIEVTDYATGFAHYAGFKAIDKQALEAVLKKCQFIRSVELQCFVDGEDLELIGKYCPYLKYFECDAMGLKEKFLTQFGIKYGHRLRIIRVNDSSYCSVFIKKFLNYCPNLKEVYTEDSFAFISEEKQFLPNLETIKSIDIRNEHLSQLKILADKYSKTMKNIKIYTYHLIGFQLRTAITHISCLENLVNLTLCISIFDEDVQTIDENIMEMAKNCTKLKSLHFTLNNESVVTNRLFYAFGKLQAIENLSLEFFDITKKLDGSIECFKSCKNLKNLTISYKELSDDFFEGVHQFVPNLKIIDIESEAVMTDKLIYSLSKLKRLQKIVFRQNACAHKSMTDDSICEMINSCEDIEKISFNARPNITHKTIDTLIAAALKRKRINIDFSCGFSAAGDEAAFAQIDVNSFADRMPENLKISIDLGQFND
jgi:Leucine-rich repeat (LRR) protein